MALQQQEQCEKAPTFTCSQVWRPSYHGAWHSSWPRKVPQPQRVAAAQPSKPLLECGGHKTSDVPKYVPAACAHDGPSNLTECDSHVRSE